MKNIFHEGTYKLYFSNDKGSTYFKRNTECYSRSCDEQIIIGASS
uniref:Uncharacterized protein n=1 Tax=Arundo donax TaxID=35708 RepID=A0A0A9FVH9_ARUDO